MTSRIRLAATLAAAATLLGTAGLAESATADPAPISVVVDSPTTGATVSGTAVAVTFTVTTAPDTLAGYTMVGFVNTVDRVWFGSACDSGCTRTVTFDSTALPPAPTSPDTPKYADGPQTISVSASTEDNQTVESDVAVVLDNQRPTEQLVAPAISGQSPYTATDRLHLAAYGTANDGGSVASMTFHYPGPQNTWLTAAFQPPTKTGGPWTLDLDTSSARAGSSRGWVTTTDDRGISSLGTMVYYVVDHGFALTGPDLSGTRTDDSLDSVQLDYAYPGGGAAFPNTYPSLVTTYLDGTQVEQHSPQASWPQDPPGTITALSGVRIPEGEHDLRYVVVDNRGVAEELDYHVTVTSTLHAAWLSGPGQSFLPGPVTLTGTADAIGTTLSDSTFYVDGTILDSWQCFTGTCPDHLDASGTGQPYPETWTPGQHQISWEVDTAHGIPMTLTGTITVLPYAQGTVDPHAPATYGQPLTVTGHVTVTGGDPAPGAEATLQRAPAAGGDWTDLATARADDAGKVTFDVTAVRSSSYRIVAATDPDRWAGQPGPEALVRSRAAITVSHRPISGRFNHYVTLRGTVGPASPRGWVYVEERRGHRWITAAQVRPTAGAYSIRYRLLHRTRTEVRVVRSASADLLAGHSAPWWIRVR